MIEYHKHPPASIQCVAAFTEWFGFSVSEDMDIQTSIAWDNWQFAWNTAKADSDREMASWGTLQMAWRIADEASREIVEGHSMAADHITRVLDVNEVASTPALEEALAYLEARGRAVTMLDEDGMAVIFDGELP